jgi:O-antigen ligase
MYANQSQSIQQRYFATAQFSVLGIGTFFFFALHIPLALLMHQYTPIATFHALATFAVAFIIAISTQRLDLLIYSIAYITGAEVLWRMTDAHVFWEFGKYATVALLLLGTLQFGLFRGPFLPILYFALLLPSCILSVEKELWTSFRGDLSFNLSGPLALALCVWFLSQVRLTRTQIHRLFLMIIAPTIGIAAIALYRTLTAVQIQWTDESNWITSGGFGPNQVSSVMGLGALCCFIFLLDSRSSRAYKLLIFLIMVMLLIQVTLTFSRSGLYLSGGGAAIIIMYLVRDGRVRAKILIAGIVLFIIGNYVILPQLNAMTGGALLARYRDTSLTGRDELVVSDVQMWQDHFFFGVGPGQSYYVPRIGREHVAAHTEFSRLLAEHGLFGLLALVSLLVMAVQSVRRLRSKRQRAIAASLLTWSFLFMMINAVRTVAPCFLFGLAAIRYLPDESND